MPNKCPRSAHLTFSIQNQNVMTGNQELTFSRKSRRERNPKANSIRTYLATVLLILSSLVPARIYAQAVYGSIGGTVVDSSGGVISGAKVTITDLDRNIVYNT